NRHPPRIKSGAGFRRDMRCGTIGWVRPFILDGTAAKLEAAMAPRKTATRRKPARTATRRWSSEVTRRSDALDLRRAVFTWSSPKRIAGSLKRSAERSRRRKTDPYRSALSMLTFYINRAGKNLPAARRKVLQRAKVELRKQFEHDAAK